MLICLGGLFGSGRRTLAHKIAHIYGYHYHDVNAHKPRRYISPDDFTREFTIQPRTDEMRLSIYRSAIAKLPLISKMYENVILEDSFHRAEPREYFLATVKDYFDKVVFVWVTCDENKILGRFQYMKKYGFIRSVEEAMSMREYVRKDFQDIGPSVLRFHHDVSDDDAAKRLHTLIMASVSSS